MRIKLKPIREQTVVVFGVPSGIGRQAALDFAKRGAKIVAARGEAGSYSLVEEVYEIKRATLSASVEKRWCGYCIVGALANFGIAALTLTKAKRALKNL